MTPEQLEALRAKGRTPEARARNAEAARRKRARETPEQKDARLAKARSPKARAHDAELHRERRAARTPEQIAADSAKRRTPEARARNNEISKESYRRHRQRVLDRSVAYRATINGRAQQILAQAKVRAKKRSLPIEIDLPWVVSKLSVGRCEATGMPFELQVGGKSPWAPSIDRIDSKQGYTLANSRVVTFLFNSAKHEFTDRDVMTMACVIAGNAQPGWSAGLL